MVLLLKPYFFAILLWEKYDLFVDWFNFGEEKPNKAGSSKLHPKQ